MSDSEKQQAEVNEAGNPVAERFVVDSKEMLALEAASEFIDAAEEAIETQGVFRVVLAGGSTPQALHQLLATEYRDEIEWSSVRFFFGDERCVARDHEDSNFRQANEDLLKPLSISYGHIFAMPGETRPIEEGAREYEATLAKEFGDDEIPQFDLIFLGLGEDGHTASLMPGSAVLEEREHWVGSIADSPKPPPERLTLTYPVLNAARRVVFLVSGSGKAEVVREILEGESPARFPAARVQPTDGELLWMMDADAAELLTNEQPETDL